MKSYRNWIASLVVPLMLTGCPAGKDVVTPSPDAKADAADRVDLKGTLDLEGERFEDFTKALEFHGYTFEMTAGGAVNIEITQLGSTQGLDTTLFVFGPKSASGSFGDEPIAFDNDGGFGDLSKIALDFHATGQYLVVVGTGNGAGHGHYRLVLECTNGTCAHCSLLPVFVETLLESIAGSRNITIDDSLSDLEIEQIFAAALHLGQIANHSGFDEVFEISDDGSIDLIDLEIETSTSFLTANWVSFPLHDPFGGELPGANMFGVVFEDGTTNIVGETRNGRIKCIDPASLWTTSVREFALEIINNDCDTENFVFGLFDEEVEQVRDAENILVETLYSATLSVGADFSGDAFILVVEPAGPDAQLEVVDLECPRASDPFDT